MEHFWSLFCLRILLLDDDTDQSNSPPLCSKFGLLLALIHSATPCRLTLAYDHLRYTLSIHRCRISACMKDEDYSPSNAPPAETENRTAHHGKSNGHANGKANGKEVELEEKPLKRK